jgi:hypothetical protein
MADEHPMAAPPAAGREAGKSPVLAAVRRVAWQSAWVLCAAAAAAGADAGPPSREAAAGGLAEAGIRWGEDWEETYRQNLAGRKAQIEAEVTDRGSRERLLAEYEVRLLAAMLDRYGGGAQRRIETYKRIADRLGEIQAHDEANEYRRRLVEQFPGRIDLAMEQLRAILRTRAEGRAKWIEYAAERLIALNDAGERAETHDAAVDALKARLDVRLAQQRLRAARSDWEALAAYLPSDDLYLRTKQGELLLHAGRAHEARGIFEALEEEERDARDAARHLRAMRKRGPEMAPIFPRQLDLQGRLEMLAAASPAEQAALANEMIADAADTDALAAAGPHRHESYWHAAMRFFAAQRPEALAGLRRLQDRQAEGLAAGSGDVRQVTSVLRRLPYARATHRLLLASGERLLRAGAWGVARRAFEDVLAYSDAEDVRRRAEVGLWLSLAQEAGEGEGGGAAALAAAFGGVDPDALYPWMGGTERAAAIRDRLMASAEAGGAPAGEVDLSRAAQVALQMPPALAWAPAQFYGLPYDLAAAMWYAHGQLAEVPPAAGGAASGGGGLLAYGPRLLARFPPGAVAPAWVRTSRWLAGGVEEFGGRKNVGVTMPAPTRPAVRRGVLYCRWGVDARYGYPRAIAAFDLRTGNMLWSTAADEAWGKLEPTTEPVVAGGRAYALAVLGGISVKAPVYIVCLDAADGSLLYKRLLGHQSIPVTRSYDSRSIGRAPDLAHYGSALTLHAGRIYAATGMGFVACCDARDGMVEWTHTYQRPVPRDGDEHLFRRFGTPPVLFDDLVIFLPRDHIGAFALHRTKGNVAWDDPFLPSDNAIGLAGPLLLLNDSRELCAVQASSGNVRWTSRMPAAITGRPVLRGESVYLATRAALRQVSVRTGLTTHRAEWAGGPLRDFVLRGDEVVGIGERSARETDGPRGNFKPSPRPASLPMASAWRLGRSMPRVILGEEDAGADGLALIVSEGALECVDLTRGGQVKWRCLIRPGFRDIAWRRGLLAVVYPDAAVAYDPLTGQGLWRREFPSFYGRVYILRRHIVLTELSKRQAAAAIDLQTGRMLWDRRFHGYYTSWWPLRYQAVVEWEGRLHMVGTDVKRPQRSFHLVCRLADGEVLSAASPFRPPGVSRASEIAVGDGVLVYVGTDRQMHELPLEGGAGGALGPKLPAYGQQKRSKLHEVRISGQWVSVRYDSGDRKDPPRYYVLRRGDPDYLLIRPQRGTIRGNMYYETADGELVVIDLPRREVVARYVLPPEGRGGDVVAVKDAGEEVLLAAFARGGRDWSSHPPRLRVDAFRSASAPGQVEGKHLGGHFLDFPDLPAARWLQRRSGAGTTPVRVWRGNTLIVSGAGGLYAYQPAPPGYRAPTHPIRVIYEAPKEVVIDGLLEEWDLSSGCEMVGEAGAEGRIMMAHDDRNFYFAVTCTDDDARCFLGDVPYAGGDFLEIGFATDDPRRHEGRHRFSLGRGVDGRTRLVYSGQGLRSDLQPRAAVAHDLASGRTNYELLVPVDALISLRWHSRALGVAAVVWDEQGAAGGEGRGPAEGSVPVLRFGSGLMAPEPIRGLFEPTRRSHLTHRQEKAALSIVAAAPGMTESMRFLRDYLGRRATEPAYFVQYYAPLLEAHAKQPVALRLMVMLDQALRTPEHGDPVAKVLEVAAAAGVPEEVRRQYVEATKPYLSQWFYSKTGIRVVEIALDDGTGTEQAWDHRALWGEAGETRPWDTPVGPAHHEAGRRRLRWTTGEWIELRVPVIAIDMHNRPIHGIRFKARKGKEAVFDRTAIVAAGGEEQVLIDEAFPPGEIETHGLFEWLTDPVKSGKRAFGYTDGGWEDRWCRPPRFPEPVTFHVVGPPPNGRPFDAARAAAAMKRHIPDLDGCPWGWRFYRELLRLAGGDLARQAEFHRWFLANNRASPDTVKVLVELEECYKALGREDPVALVEADIKRLGVLPEPAYFYRSDHVHAGKTFVRDWRVLGPVWRKGEAARPPELDKAGEKIDLAGRYGTGKEGETIRWLALHSGYEDGKVDLATLYGEPRDCYAYAVCWVHCDRPTEAYLEFGVDDHGWVYLNRERLLAWTWGGGWEPGNQRLSINLPAGWSELLVKAQNGVAGWGFWLELVSPDGRGMPPGVRISAEPPASTRPAAPTPKASP